MTQVKFKEVQSLLNNGKNPKEIFDDIDFEAEGFRMAELNNKWNYLDKKGKLLSTMWFDKCHKFYNGFGIVKLNDKHNYIKSDGKLLSEEWFDNCYEFNEGFGIVELNGKRNYLKPDGTLLSDTWFDYCYKFMGGFDKVEINSKKNYIKSDATLLFDKWFNEIVANYYSDCIMFTVDGNVYICDKSNKLYARHEYLKIKI